MKTLKIKVPDMQSHHCQQNVRSALETLEGAEILSIVPGEVQVTVPATADALTVLEVIRTAGYTVVPEESDSGDSARGETVRYKTNINCSGCVEKVANTLNTIEGVHHWEVDTGSLDKTLLVEYTDNAEQDVLAAVQEKGFRIERIK